MVLINTLISFLSKIAAFIAVILLCVHFLLLQELPRVSVSSAQQVDQAQSVNDLIYDLSKVFKERHVGHNVAVSQAQAQSLLGFMQRAIPKFNGTIDFAQTGGVLHMSILLEKWFTPRYVNITLQLASSQQVDITHLSVGRLPLPGNAVLSLVSWGVNAYTDSQIATQAQAQIDTLTFSPRKAVLSVMPMHDFLTELKLVRERIDFGGDNSQEIRISYYLGFLMNVQSIPKTDTTSLSAYIRELMLEAQIQSQPETAHLENEAAILALAIYAGSSRFANFVGLAPPVGKDVLYGDFMPKLAKRTDLSQHFIFSAAIKLLSDQGVTVAIGEFKELMDRVVSGSGYSFVDLAADKAGVKFADYLADPDTAKAAQSRLAIASDEALFFPVIKDLPEGLKTDAFRQTFKTVDSPEYQAMIAEIKGRIAGLGLYRSR
jgi:hypothetical protein